MTGPGKTNSSKGDKRKSSRASGDLTTLTSLEFNGDDNQSSTSLDLDIRNEVISTVGQILANDYKLQQIMSKVHTTEGAVQVLQSDVAGLQLLVGRLEALPDKLQELLDKYTEVQEQLQTFTQEQSMILTDQSICLRDKLPAVLVTYATRVLRVKEDTSLPVNLNLSEPEVLVHPDLWVIGLIMGKFTPVDFAETDTPGLVTRVTYIKRALRKLLPEELDITGPAGDSLVKKWVSTVCQHMAMILSLLQHMGWTSAEKMNGVSVEKLLTFRAKYEVTFSAAEECIKEVTEATQDHVIGEGFSALRNRGLTAYAGNLTATETTATTQALRNTSAPEEGEVEKEDLRETIRSLRANQKSLKAALYARSNRRTPTNKGGQQQQQQQVGGKRTAGAANVGGGGSAKKKQRRQ